MRSKFDAVEQLLERPVSTATGDMRGCEDDPRGHWRGWFDGAIKQGRDKGIGYWVLSPADERSEGHMRTGVGTSNQAEYEALICCLKLLLRRGARRAIVRGDSQLIIYQTIGRWSIKEPTLQPFAAKARQLMANFESIELVWVRRELNTEADLLSNKPFIGYIRDRKI